MSPRRGYMSERRRERAEEFARRLRRAFAGLRRRGFFARLSWQCCQSCGNAALPEQYNGRRDYSVAFCHRQDMEHAREDGAIYVAFGARVNSSAMPVEEREQQEREREVGRAIVEEAARAGLYVEWDGRECTRPYLSLLPESLC